MTMAERESFMNQKRLKLSIFNCNFYQISHKLTENLSGKIDSANGNLVAFSQPAFNYDLSLAININMLNLKLFDGNHK